MLEQIIEEEVVKGKGYYDTFGSYHGYQTFLHGEITNNVEECVIREISLPYYLNKKITALHRLWISNIFAPGGTGYQQAMNELKK